MNIKLSVRLTTNKRLFDSVEGSNTTSFAERELDLLQVSTPDALILPFRPEIIALCTAFGRSGQSGASAPFTAGALSQAIKSLCMQLPIAPVMNTEDEWNDISDVMGSFSKQNNRCSAVFMDEAEKPYYLDAIVWQGAERYDTFTGGAYVDDSYSELVRSSQFCRFPFTPKTFYVDVQYVLVDKDDAEARGLHYIEDTDGRCHVSVVKDKDQLAEVWDYYDKRTVQ